MNLLLGFDIGSSSVKASLMDASTGMCVASATSPKTEMEMISVHPGWAEQHPAMWWQNLVKAMSEIRASFQFAANDVKAIGVAYQMHGLVTVDKAGKVLRPAIIWCDSRAVGIGEKAAMDLGEDHCLKSLLNLPGNFTASKLKWVKDNEPEVYRQIYKIMLPGDYIAYRLTGRMATTRSGLSEGILWDFPNRALADFMMEYYGFDQQLIPGIVDTFAPQGELNSIAAGELGLASGIPIAYRAGDQPNNALSLNVLNPGEMAVTAGTSGVVYGISDTNSYDPQSRVNVFLHVNDTASAARRGILLCVNGTGILNSWLRRNVAGRDGKPLSYEEMNDLAAQAPIGSDGLVVLPYGNGAERTLMNRNKGASFQNLNFNRHGAAHLLRAGQEGIVFALNYGLEIMKAMGMQVSTVRAGHANMFLSPLFAEAFATVTGATVELFKTDGSQGAARGVGIGAGIYKDTASAFEGLQAVKRIVPNAGAAVEYAEAYEKWKERLEEMMGL